MQRQQMAKVSVDVRSGTARFRVGVQVGSIKNALSLAAGRYPQGEVRVVFPAEPAGYLVRAPSAPAPMLGATRARAA